MITLPIDNIVKKNVGLLVGCYDAEHGNEDFMLGISTVIGYLALQASVEKHEKISKMFLANMVKSQERAEKKKIHKNEV